MTSSQKRSFKELQGATIDDDELLQEPWYAINPDEIVMMVENMCDKLTAPLQKYTNIDSRFQDVIDAVNRKRKLPDVRQFNVAVLGEQGTGKSSVINALLDRGLLDRSGSSKACTAYATILEYKKSASDQTNLSDLTVEFLNEEEIRHIIKEQINHWTDVYPGHKKGHDSLLDADADEDEDEDRKFQLPAYKSLNASSRGALTAKEFFEIVFNVRTCSETRTWLEKQLHHTNIQEGDFFETCYEKARSRFAQMDKEKKEFNLEMRKARCINVPDRKLWKETTVIKELWPFVKAVTISTGHVLLRHGLRLFDLPGESLSSFLRENADRLGYGDMSQLREAVVNNFRREADFEMVIAPFSRLQTSVVQERYINWSIHLKGANKTILVMNKSDELLNEDNMGTQLSEINEDPFSSLRERLEAIEDMQNSNDLKKEDDLECQGGIDDQTISGLLDEIVKEIIIAYIKYETANVQKMMHPKGIRVFSVSALAHTRAMNRRRKGTDVLDEKTAGILELRNFLAKLPAVTNYQNYHDHVYRALVELRKEAAHPLERHLEDETYAAMRHDLGKQIQSLGRELQGHSDKLSHELLEPPWSGHDKQNIVGSIKHLTEEVWTHPNIHASGYAKMLRENGIPVNGKYHGRNMNAELLSTMEKHINRWCEDMNFKAGRLAQFIFKPVKALLLRTQLAIDESSAQLALKHVATEELRLASQRIEGIHNTLLTNLRNSLAKTHLYFTTEIDIYCPIAKEMKACYDRALDRELVHSGSGTYSRQRRVLCASIIKGSDTGIRPLVKKIEELLQTQQRKCWEADCNTFIVDTIDQLNSFLNTTKQFLQSASYITVEHFQARSELMKLLADFDADLREIQSRFENNAEEHIGKKAKYKDS
ncbi:Dynamin N domain containing protein [Curvularia clavata]|uniref:Dynamin N domain containing protein n=1 Tax=Curvularia clavata TaxID=95742 RepID=A0A9Q9DRB6_CURCL|nr:Dynamin N domain containing protein [Curvularia clavata]